jgi:hypothetical protein
MRQQLIQTIMIFPLSIKNKLTWKILTTETITEIAKKEVVLQMIQKELGGFVGKTVKLERK